MSSNDTTTAASFGERTVIGISFGNSNSSIAFTTSENKAEVITNEDGDRQIPSILSYIDGEEYNGQQAKQLLVRNSNNTVAYFRDLLGQEYQNVDTTHCQASALPISHQGTIAFKICDKVSDEESIVTISEIVSRHIRRLVQSASAYIGKVVDAAVITIPTNFSEQQKDSLLIAAKDGGIDIIQLIHEPIAALLAYDSLPDARLTDKTVVVADLGGTRSDVAVIASRGGIYTILSSIHDSNVAGVFLDQALQDHFAKEFIKWNGEDADPRKNARSRAKLKIESEATKKALSIGSNACFSVESLNIGIDFSSTINRLRYEMIARKVFEGVNQLIKTAVEKAGLDVLEIDEVILSGGTSHTPKIAANMRNIFTSPKTTIFAPSTMPSAINPSELQARGAAIQASLVKDYDFEELKNSTELARKSVLHLSKSIGVLSISDDIEKGLFTPIFLAETSVPIRRVIRIATPREGGDVLVKIVEGESYIKVSKPEPRPKSEKTKNEDDSDSNSDSEEEEEEEIRVSAWKVGQVLAEAAIRGVSKGGKIDIAINIAADMSISMKFWENGTKTGTGVSGTIDAP